MKILLYTNILTPYRSYFYDLMFKECKKNNDEFKVAVMSNTESNRVWKYNDYKREYTELLDCKTITKGNIYIHINFGLLKLIKKYKPDIVISAGSYLCPGTWLIPKYSKKYKYKAFFWSESHLDESRTYNKLKLFIREKIRRKFYSYYDGFLYPGKKALDFINYYSKKESMKVFLPNLVDESKYNNSKFIVDELCDSIHNNGKLIFFIPARLISVKGIKPFFYLWSKCHNKDKASMIIAGDGDLKEELVKAAEQLKLNVYFVGNKSSEEVANLYKNTDIFCLPSLSDANPLTCVEAIWSKKPLIVSSNVGNYPEVVLEKKNGYVFSYTDEQNAIKKIEMIIDSSSLWRCNAEKVSYDIANNLYNSERNTKRLLSELKKIAQKN